MKKKKKKILDEMCKASDGRPQPEPLYTEHYFSSPIYWTDKPEWVKGFNTASDAYIKQARLNNLDEIKKRNKKFGNKGEHPWVHHSTTLIGDPKFKIIQDYIGSTAWNLLDGQGFDLTNYSIFVTELWVQEFSKNGGGHHTLHTHWNGHISGFFFLKASEKTSLPVFEDPRNGRMMNLLPQKDPSKITQASHQVNYQVKPGRLIFFNSFMPHMYSVDSGYEPFRFIHFNIQAIPNSVLGIPYKPAWGQRQKNENKK
jgi:uncharacterized protein (TIGR02466 family)|tara:strand:+ start:1257 stop:2024 length:768 start_codon:yes stop_codon:yes gene_type:complete